MNRVEVERIIDYRCGAFLEIVSRDGNEGQNPYLVDPIGWAIRMLGYTTAAHDDLTDADVTQVATGHLDALLDLAELRTLEMVQGNLTLVDLKTGPIDEKLGQLSSRLAQIIPEKRDAIAAQHNDILTKPLSGSDKRTAVVRAI